MKNYIRKLAAGVIVIAVAASMTTVTAATKDAKGPGLSIQKSVSELEKSQKKAQSQVQEKVSELKQKHEAFKAEIQSKKDTIKANNAQLQSIRKEIVNKKQAINAIFDALTESKKVVPSDLFNAIKAQAKVLKADLQAVNSGKGTLEKAGSDVAGQVKIKNSDGVVKGLDTVIAKQTARITALNQLDSDLAVMLELAQKAQSLATDPADSASSDSVSSASAASLSGNESISG